MNCIYINWQPFQPMLYILLSVVTEFNEFKRIVGYYICPDISNFCSSPVIPDVPYPSSKNSHPVWVTFFSNSFGRSCLALSALRFPSFENIFILLSFLKDILCLNLELWIDISFLSKLFFHFLVSTTIISIIFLLSIGTASFSVTAFKIFSLV